MDTFALIMTLSVFFNMQTPSVKTTQTHAFSYSRVDFNKVNNYIIENPSHHTAIVIATNFWKRGMSGFMKSCLQQFPLQQS